MAQADTPQGLVNAFAELSKKKVQIKANQKFAEERIAELNGLYVDLEASERKIFSGDRNSNSGDTNQARGAGAEVVLHSLTPVPGLSVAPCSTYYT